jgi:hypothetical protein
MAITAGEAEYALRQAILALHVYRKHDPIEQIAVSMARFYVSAAAMRLYAGEHASSAILDILGLSEGDLASGKGAKRTSLQAKLAMFLKQNEPTHEITIAGNVLGNCPEWFKTLQYRGRLTHG